MTAASTRRNSVAALAALIAFGAVNGGLFFHARPLQVGLFVGLVCGLVATGTVWAAVIGASVATVGLVIMPAPMLPLASVSTLALASTPLVAGVAGAGVRFAVQRWRAGARVLVWAGVALLVANLWVTSLAWDSVSLDDPGVADPFPSLIAQLQGADVGLHDDASSYIATYQRVRSGVPYYEAFLQSHREWDNGRVPAEVWGFRQPLLFWLWRALPGNGTGLVVGLLVLSTGALLSVFALGTTVVKRPLVLPACAAVAAVMFHSLTDRQIVYAEGWTVCFVLMSLGATAWAARSKRPGAWTAVAVGLAVVAALLRELAAPLLLAGLLAAWAGRRGRFAVLAWAAGSVVFGAAYAAHAVRVWGILSHGGTSMTGGGFDNLYRGLVHGTRFFGGAGWFPLVLGLAGIVAIAFLPDRELRVQVGIYAGVLVASWLFISNNATSDLIPGQVQNYWGKLVVPVLYATTPAILAAVPGMARARAASVST